ncbi:hypothetical protein F3Y22_tig00110514pilonHSYRG00005 [Hibiscus syriacus]|uniref:BEACH-type PH domain-containing protein n=1 Tax=Hibiscus syriacus TaxID=106335 RepID=A0A6A3AFR2_HIBSY|nr:hypothetical protein F3Y22_tig00110514pilonHSYRG00005 [Hibiscus syriacus]
MRFEKLYGKSMLAACMVGKDDLVESSSQSREIGPLNNLIHKDRLLSAVAEESKYIKVLESDRSRHLQELRSKMNENSFSEINNQKAFEGEIESSLHTILASDESRRNAFLLAHEEEQIIVTEATQRRRPKLRRNYHFDDQLCHSPSTSPCVHKITDKGSSGPGGSGFETSKHFIIPDAPSNIHTTESVKRNIDHIDIVPARKEFSSPVETETSEVLMSLPCVLVTPKRKLAGQLAVMKHVLHFFGKFLVKGTIGSSVFKNLNASSHSQLEKADQKIKAAHWTRYFLRYTAVEIFFSDSVAPIFINFASQKNSKDIGTLIVSTRNELLFPRGSSRDKSATITFVDRRAAVRKRQKLLWKDGREGIYPILNYLSEVLDFKKSVTFQDLSKPVGAPDSKRFEVSSFQLRCLKKDIETFVIQIYLVSIMVPTTQAWGLCFITSIECLDTVFRPGVERSIPTSGFSL